MKKNRNKKIRVSSLRIHKVKMRRRRIVSDVKTYQQSHLAYLLNYSCFIGNAKFNKFNKVESGET